MGCQKGRGEQITTTTFNASVTRYKRQAKHTGADRLQR
jgi:hypothetical protein